MEGEGEQPELNVELYDDLMASIGRLWLDFDIDSGLIDYQNFK